MPALLPTNQLGLKILMSGENVVQLSIKWCHVLLIVNLKFKDTLSHAQQTAKFVKITCLSIFIITIYEIHRLSLNNLIYWTYELVSPLFKFSTKDVTIDVLRYRVWVRLLWSRCPWAGGWAWPCQPGWCLVRQNMRRAVRILRVSSNILCKYFLFCHEKLSKLAEDWLMLTVRL